MRRFRFVLTLILLVSIIGCGYDENQGLFMAPGSYSDLAVVVSRDDLSPLARRFLDQLNTTRTFVIKEEPNFIPDFYGPDRWDLSQKYKNSVYLIRIGDGGPVEKAVRRLLPEETWKRLSEGAGGVVKMNDPWASYQMAVVAASRDRNNLASLLTKNRDKIEEIFSDSSRERILRRNRYEGLNVPVMDDHWQRFGYFMEIPLEFDRNQFLPDGYPGVELMKKSPSRGITVTWKQVEDPQGMLGRESDLAQMRRELGDRMHDEDLHDDTFVWSPARIGDADGVLLEGAWTSRKFSGGGAFWSYFIPAPELGRMYCVDLLVFAPGMDKMEFFRHLDAIAHTFTTHRPQP